MTKRYRIAYRSHGKIYHGEYLLNKTKEQVEILAAAYNRKCPEICHWVEESEEDEPLEKK